MRHKSISALVAFVIAAASPAALAQHAGHAKSAAADTRFTVEMPAPVRAEMLALMRDHLLAVQEIQQALADGAWARAASLAEDRLGMNSLRLRGPNHMADFVPEGMRAIGMELHRSASQLAREAANVAATGNVRPALAALARTTQQCVACHAVYQLK